MALVLVAEDEDPVRRLLSLVLSNGGHQVLEAANGLEAVALFRSNYRAINLVITDLYMPVMDGFQVISRIRETAPQFPVIVITAYAEQPLPPDTYLVKKPFTPRSLLDVVERILAR